MGHYRSESDKEELWSDSQHHHQLLHSDVCGSAWLYVDIPPPTEWRLPNQTTPYSLDSPRIDKARLTHFGQREALAWRRKMLSRAVEPICAGEHDDQWAGGEPSRQGATGSRPRGGERERECLCLDNKLFRLIYSYAGRAGGWQEDGGGRAWLLVSVSLCYERDHFPRWGDNSHRYYGCSMINCPLSRNAKLLC